jgi:hypothetical protein
MTSDDEWEELSPAAVPAGALPPGIRNVLGEAEGLLLQLAEAGTQRLTDANRGRIGQLARRISNGGFMELSRGLEAMLGESPLAGSVLWTNYVCRLCWQALGNLGGAGG